MSLIDKTILVVEDDDIARGVLDLILKKYFRKVYTASNGQEGLEKSAQHSPDLIVADLAMPVLDGFVMIRRLEEQFSETPVLIVTAYREEAEVCGSYRILHKPVDRKELLKAIGDVLDISIDY